MLVQFLKGWTVYNAGECAHFPAHVASKLVETGVAEEITSEAPVVLPASKARRATPKSVVEK